MHLEMVLLPGHSSFSNPQLRISLYSFKKGKETRTRNPLKANSHYLALFFKLEDHFQFRI